MANDDDVVLDAVYKFQTRAAWLFDFGDEESVWIPKSQCVVDTSPNRANLLRRGDSVTVTVPEWLALDKGLI
jgi:hypothetical protein